MRLPEIGWISRSELSHLTISDVIIGTATADDGVGDVR